MESQKSIIWPIVLSILGSAVVFGGAGYYLATSLRVPESADTPAKTSPKSATTKPTVTPISSSSPAIINKTITPDPTTATWKNYTNTEFGFSFKYPSQAEWTVEEVDPLKEYKNYPGDNIREIKVKTPNGNLYEVTITKNPLAKQVELYRTELRSSAVDIKADQEIIAYNKKGHLFTTTANSHPDPLAAIDQYLFSISDNRTIIIPGETRATDFKTYLNDPPTINKIVTTFKFID